MVLVRLLVPHIAGRPGGGGRARVPDHGPRGQGDHHVQVVDTGIHIRLGVDAIHVVVGDSELELNRGSGQQSVRGVGKNHNVVCHAGSQLKR